MSKRGQIVAVIFIFLIIAVVLGVLFFARKETRAGKALQQPMPEVPDEIVTKAYLPIETSTEETPIPIKPPKIQSPVPVEEKSCKASYSARTCHAATALAMRQCPSDYVCKTIAAGWSAEGCHIEIYCTPRDTSAIRRKQTYPFGIQPQPYAAGY